MAFLPMFPLKLVVYPNENLNLHIFEPRYRELVNDCLLFGIPKFDQNRVVEYGTEVELLETTKTYPTGESDIKTKGRRRFRILNFYRKLPVKLYGGAEVEFLKDDWTSNPIILNEIIALIHELYEALNINKTYDPSQEGFSTFDLGHHIGLSSQQEYELLMLDNEMERENYILKHLKKMIPTVIEMKNLQDKVKMNGHFKNLDPLKF